MWKLLQTQESKTLLYIISKMVQFTFAVLAGKYQMKYNLKACLHGGGEIQVGNLLRWGNPPVHIISHFKLITFT